MVGCFLLGPEGVPLPEGHATPEMLLSSDFAVTRELIRCVTCNECATLDDARTAADLPTQNVLWEDTEHNIKMPVVCPVCQNQQHFVKQIIRASIVDELVEIQDGKVVSTTLGGDPALFQEISLRYLCDIEECDGVVVLHSAGYDLVKVS